MNYYFFLNVCVLFQIIIIMFRHDPLDPLLTKGTERHNIDPPNKIMSVLKKENMMLWCLQVCLCNNFNSDEIIHNLDLSMLNSLLVGECWKCSLGEIPKCFHNFLLFQLCWVRFPNGMICDDLYKYFDTFVN